jgi:hypothetical protein
MDQAASLAAADVAFVAAATASDIAAVPLAAEAAGPVDNETAPLAAAVAAAPAYIAAAPLPAAGSPAEIAAAPFVPFAALVPYKDDSLLSLIVTKYNSQFNHLELVPFRSNVWKVIGGP